MRKLITMALLCVLNSAANADLTKFGGNDGVKVYIDKLTVIRTGPTVTMTDLFDYTTTQQLQNVKYLSMKRKAEYNCKDSKQRILSASFYSGNMGSNILVLGIDEPAEWRTPIKESVNEDMLKLVCKTLL